MLYSFKKYKTGCIKHIDLQHKLTNILSLSYNYIIVKKSTFFRKMFFRTLLLYINLLNCNFFYTANTNFFYFIHYIYATYSLYHPSFYMRQIYKI